MKGILLAGGEGTRLLPATKVTNKHLLMVYNRLMIDYPLKTLIDIGCTEILIVSGGGHIGDFAEYLGDGSDRGVDISYKVQKEAGGVAHALLCGEEFIGSDELFPVILGDNYFEKPILANKPCVIVKEVEDPHRYGVYDPIMNMIVEKPTHPVSTLAVTGLYWYSPKVFTYAKQLKPSKRGELEITDINNLVLGTGGDSVLYTHFWSDMGTPDSLLEVANYVKSLD